MYIYTFVEAIVGIVAAIMIARRAKKSENVTYGKLDRAGRIVNIVLAIAYACATPFYFLLAILSVPDYDISLGIFRCIAAAVVAILISSPSMVCSISIGASIALRQNGKSKASFAVQFAGVAALAIAFILFALFYDMLMVPLN